MAALVGGRARETKLHVGWNQLPRNESEKEGERRWLGSQATLAEADEPPPVSAHAYRPIHPCLRASSSIVPRKVRRSEASKQQVISALDLWRDNVLCCRNPRPCTRR